MNTSVLPERIRLAGEPEFDLAAGAFFAALSTWSVPVTGFDAEVLTTTYVLPAASSGASVWHSRTTDGQVAIDIAAAPQERRSIAHTVRSIKARSGLTWDQLAELCGVSRRAVHGWAAGARLTSRHTEVVIRIERLLDAVEVPDDPGATRAAVLRAASSPVLQRVGESLRARRGSFLERLGAPTTGTRQRDTGGDEIEIVDLG